MKNKTPTFNATYALSLFRRGRSIETHQGNRGQITGTALGMELARNGRHRKLVLYVKLAHEFGDNGAVTERIYPHYALDQSTLES